MEFQGSYNHRKAVARALDIPFYRTFWRATAEDRPWTTPLQHRELLPEREILQEEMPTTARCANRRSEPDKKQIEHGAELYQINDREYRRMLLILQSARILANHRFKSWGAAHRCRRPK
jgi:hypothetical protein